MNKFKILIIIIIVIAIIGFTTTIIINQYVKSFSKKYIQNENIEIKDIDAILILGCQVNSDGTLSHMLKDRVDKGIELYQNKVASKIIVSGDHGEEHYDETKTMKNYLIANGIPSEDIFMDHAGFSTYESMYRAEYIFKVKKIIVVTQEYHLYRAVYIGNKLGIETYGVKTEDVTYYGQISRDIREFLARNKDFIKCIFKPHPTYLGDSIPVTGNGDATNDKTEV